MIKYICNAMFVILLLCASSCNDTFSDNPNHRLSFSVDTLSFDTVFTTIGSATAVLMVYNENDKPLKIERVNLNRSSASYFSINVDGMANADNSVCDVEIGAGDSIYVFVEVLIDPANQSTPMFVEDQLEFSVNNSLQTVQLEAYGQDVEILRRKFILNDTTLRGDKPYLVYDYLAVDTAMTLTLPAGCTLYFHDKAQMVVYGHLRVEGTLEKPVVMRGSRLDYMLPDIPYNSASGQWDGVYLVNENGEHSVNYLHINSGYNGLYLSNTNIEKSPMLKVTNSRIHNFSYYGLVVQNADVEVTNTEISNCGTYCAYLSGGDHVFTHVTIANYYNYPSTMLHPNVREDKPAICINDIPKAKVPMTTVFSNSIVAGSRTNEFGLYTTFPDKYNGIFLNNVIQSDSLRSFPQFERTVWVGNTTRLTDEGDTIRLFRNIRYESDSEWKYYDFLLDSASVASGVANFDVALTLPIDKNGADRMLDGQPDAGAYEYSEE